LEIVEIKPTAIKQEKKKTNDYMDEKVVSEVRNLSEENGSLEQTHTINHRGLGIFDRFI
jgi:hypothetical protein